MKGIITKRWAAAWVAGGMTLMGGCECYRNIVDPCYPQRYAFQSRQEVNASLAPQVNNGHVLDQTVWSYQFEAGTDRMTPGGMEHLDYLARRRPCPDPTIYLQTAQDIVYDPAVPDKFAEARSTLDGKRIQAIQNYLSARTAGRHLSFEVLVHDPAEVGQPTIPVALEIQKFYLSGQGALPNSAGAGAAGASGGGGAK